MRYAALVLLVTSLIAAAIVNAKIRFGTVVPRPEKIDRFVSTPPVVQKTVFAPLITIGFAGSDDLSLWYKHQYTGEADTHIKRAKDGTYVLDFKSNDNATLLYKGVDVEMDQNPHLTWEWRVNQFPSGKKNQKFAHKSENDFGARVYVVFKGMTKLTSPTIQYIWDTHFPEGTQYSVPFFKHLKMLVIRKTDEKEAGVWHRETRDIVEDYEMIYGEPPKKPIRAIGLMSDSDETGTQSHAQYRNLAIVVPLQNP